MSPPDEPITIHAAAYPHIIDSIFRHADGTSLITLRAACREWRQRADAALAMHLAVGPSSPHLAVGPSSPILRRDGRVRRRPSGPIYALGRGERVRHPAFRTFPHAGTTQAWAESARANKYVDWYEPRPGNAAPPPFFERPKEVVRMWEDSMPQRGRNEPTCVADTIAVFGWPSEHFLSNPDPTINFRCLPFANPTTEGTRKLVLNLSAAQISRAHRRDECASGSWLAKRRRLDEIVVVYHPHEPPADDVRSQLPHRLRDLLRMAVRGPETPRFTFVNLDALPRALSGSILDDEGIDLLGSGANAASLAGKTFREVAAAMLEEEQERRIEFEVLTGWPRDQMPGQVEVISFAEYEARVGAERFRYETMERPWEG